MSPVKERNDGVLAMHTLQTFYLHMLLKEIHLILIKRDLSYLGGKQKSSLTTFSFTSSLYFFPLLL